MGRKSRRKWEHRRNPPSIHRPLETRWGTHPLARAWGGMLQGLGIGAVAAGALTLIAAARYTVLALGGDRPSLDGVGALALLYPAGFLAGGAVAGVLAPIRDAIGGRRAQGIVMMAVTGLVWMPLLRQITGGRDPGALWFAWALCAVIFGLVFAKWFGVLDDRHGPGPMQNMYPDFRSGRQHRIR